jgi:pyridoxal/pyridoxine/pyridoxamine kinase
VDFDRVGTNALTFQLQRSGAGVWTATTTNLSFEAIN